MDYKDLTADQILAISPSSYDKLFTIDNLKLELSRLRRLWHPDVCKHPRATDVFSHISAIFTSAESAKESNTWKGKAFFEWTNKDSGKKFKLDYLTRKEFELGFRYLSHGYILYMIKSEFSDLFDNGLKFIKELKYDSDRMKVEFSRFVPQIIQSNTLEDGSRVVLMKKTHDIVPLRDLLDHLGGKIPHRHVAWMINRLYNLCVFFNHNRICHAGLTLDNIFVDPIKHGIMIYGGWWYASVIGYQISKVPAELLPFYPNELKSTKQTSSKVDTTVVKAIGIQLLGDSTGTGSKLFSDKNIPPELIRSLQVPPSGRPLEVFRNWHDILMKCYGKREFVEFNVNPREIYN